MRAVQTTTGKRITVRGKQFADCTGDATLSRLAGATTDYGREGTAEFDEPLAPPVRDRATAGSTISLRARDVGYPVAFTPPDWAVRYRDPSDLGPFRELRAVDRDEFGGFWWFEIGYPFHQITGTEQVRDELYRHVLGVWDYLKNHHPRRERFTRHALDWVGSVVGKRESARVLGDVVLTEHDCHRDQRWPDRIAGAGWYLDLHNPYGLLDVSVPGEPSSVDETYRAWVRVPPFSVPLRSCMSRDVANLWLGGRLVSATHVANGALRVQLTLGQLGQATGIAAAHALAHGIDPRDVATAPHIGAVQQRALLRDVRIPGVALEDPDDLAPLARVSASSEAVLDLATPEPGDARELDHPWAQVFPVSTGRIETVGVHLRNDGPAAPLRWRLEEVDTLWQRESGRRVAHGRATVAAGHDGVLRLEVGAATRPVLHRLVVRGRPGVHWTAARGQPVGTVAQVLHVAAAGRHSGAQLPRFAHWGQDKWVSLTVDCDPPQRPYGPGNVVSGVAHPEAGTNLWASDPAEPLPQWLRLDWPWPVRLDELALWFDTNLNTKLGLAPGQWTPPETVRDYTVDGRTGGGWRRMATVSGNRTRLNRLDLPPWPVTALRLNVSANHERPPDTDLSRQFGYWRRDGDRAVRDDGPRGARVYQIVAHGARISPAPSRRDGAPAGG